MKLLNEKIYSIEFSFSNHELQILKKIEMLLIRNKAKKILSSQQNILEFVGSSISNETGANLIIGINYGKIETKSEGNKLNCAIQIKANFLKFIFSFSLLMSLGILVLIFYKIFFTTSSNASSYLLLLFFPWFGYGMNRAFLLKKFRRLVNNAANDCA